MNVNYLISSFLIVPQSEDRTSPYLDLNRRSSLLNRFNRFLYKIQFLGDNQRRLDSIIPITSNIMLNCQRNCISHQELLTRHKSTVAEYLNNTYDWFSHSIMHCWNLLTSPDEMLLRC
ncbi:hypothetical protein L1987_46960 [Smallanthus sonchifolius]|uniref:Uncharacterized protein n=1 Tax=Smallanthus sonchifolius TaxID=185202 RepID=A0ACB9G0X0_9ASTR|nr:hypothetical protein L1987_46960 [Smallanthus sonchifolius]